MASTAKTPPRGPFPRRTRPPVSHEPRLQEISDALAAKGYHPFSAPCGILLDESDRNRSQCIRCAWCDGYPCMVHAKADAEVMAVRPSLPVAERDPRDRSYGVTRLETDPSGRTVTGVEVDRGGDTEVYQADIVVVAAGAANSAKILLNSANARPSHRAGQRIGPGRPQLHVPQLQGTGLAEQGAQRHGVPEDARHQRFLFRRWRSPVAPREHPDGGQVERRGHEGRGTEADPAGPPLDASTTWPSTRWTGG